jgi:hypothetical protein
MFKAILISLFLVCTVSAVTKTDFSKVVKPDTTVSVKPDTTKTVVFDTLKITRTFKDTLIFLKADTVRSPSKPQLLKK